MDGDIVEIVAVHCGFGFIAFGRQFDTKIKFSFASQEKNVSLYRKK